MTPADKPDLPALPKLPKWAADIMTTAERQSLRQHIQRQIDAAVAQARAELIAEMVPVAWASPRNIKTLQAGFATRVTARPAARGIRSALAIIPTKENHE